MRQWTRTLSCALIAALLLTVAATAAACGKKAEYPTVSEVTEPQTVGEVIPAVDRQEQLAAAKRANPDTAAWLYMPGAEVDDAVMQAADNGYYLQKDENGNFSEWGCYYAHCDDHLSSRSALDKNTVIFGHSATNCDPDGPKFTKLHRYMDTDFVQENPYIYLSVEGDDMVFQITACFITDISFDYISPNLAGEELTGFLRQVEEKNWPTFTEQDGTTRKVDYKPAEGWIELEDGVYYREVSKSTENQVFQILKDDQVTVSENLTKRELDTVNTQPKLTFTVYAVQKEGVNSASDAWSLANSNN